jgi:hypothetical protein
VEQVLLILLVDLAVLSTAMLLELLVLITQVMVAVEQMETSQRLPDNLVETADLEL